MTVSSAQTLWDSLVWAGLPHPELQNSTVEGACLFVCKIIHFPGSLLSLECSCEGPGFSVMTSSDLCPQVSRVSSPPILRDKVCFCLCRWRHDPIAIVTPLVGNFYFATTAFIAQLFYLKCWTFVYLRISELVIGNSVMVLCTNRSIKVMEKSDLYLFMRYIRLLGWLVFPFLSHAQNAEPWGPGCVREK